LILGMATIFLAPLLYAYAPSSTTPGSFLLRPAAFTRFLPLSPISPNSVEFIYIRILAPASPFLCYTSARITDHVLSARRDSRLCVSQSFLIPIFNFPFSQAPFAPLLLSAYIGITVSRKLFGERMNPIYIAAAIFALLLTGLVVWVLVQNTQDQKKSEALESQMNELRRDLLGLSTAQTQSSTKMETIAGTVAARLEAMTSALKDGVKDSAEVTSKITSEAQSAMSTELKNTREQIGQIQKQLGEVQQAGEQMHKAAQSLENILGGSKSRGNFGETTLGRMLEDSLPSSQYSQQYRFRSGEAADAVIHLRDKKIMAIDSKFPLDAYLRLTQEGEEPRRSFVTAVKGHADSIARKYIVPDENTLDVALMFVPSESVYYELLKSTDGKGLA